MNTPDRLTCEQVFRRLDDYLDRELTAAEMEMVRRHIETCAACASEYRFQRSVIDGVREKLQRITAPPDLLAKVKGMLDRVSAG